MVRKRDRTPGQRSIFDPAEDEKRDELKRRGWLVDPGSIRGFPAWRDPETGGLYEEAEAFKKLERILQEERKHAKSDEGGEVPG